MRKSRLLLVTTVSATARAFLTPFALAMKSRGWQVDLATSGPVDGLIGPFQCVHSIPWARSLLALRQNLRAGLKIRNVIAEGVYDVVHVHTPIAAFITRLFVSSRSRKSTVVIYTAHGFHFHRNGGAVSNWIYRFAEWIAGRWCETIIVINEEDYRAAQALWGTGSPTVVYMPGIGIDLQKYSGAIASGPHQSHLLKKELKIPPDGRLAVMIAEFNPGKRHRDAIRALAAPSSLDIYMAFAGEGPLLEATRDLARDCGVLERCRFLGYVQYIPRLIASADVVLLPSEREGLPRAVMEAMAIGVPVVGADSRGTRDLLGGGCGLLHEVGDIEALALGMRVLLDDPLWSRDIVRRARERISTFDIEVVKSVHERLYSEAIDGSLRPLVPLGPLAPPRRRRVVISGGTGRSLINFRGELIKEFRYRGWEVVCTAFDRDAETIEQLWRLGADYRQVPLSRTGVSPLSDWRGLLIIRNLRNWFRPDRFVCYTHKPVLYTALACGGAGSGCVGMVTGLGYAFTEDLGFSAHRRWAKFVLRGLMLLAFRRLDGIIFQNGDDRDLLRRIGVVSKELSAIVVPGSGVDVRRFSSSGWTGDAPIFVFVGRTLRSKGILEFLAACARVRLVLDRARFVVVGESDSNPDAVEKGLFKEYAFAAGVEIVGEVDDVRPYIEMASAFVLPSYREGLPRTALEAMAMSRAIITTNVPGCRETVFGLGREDASGVRIGRNGVLVRVRDVDSLAAGMLYVGSNPAVAREMGVEGRRLAEEIFDVRLVNKKILRFLDVGV
jgi:glycosyltransferase involved in cell wall biosynthesis